MEIFEGDLSVDDRGIVSFVNDFDFKDVKRFYLVSNHSKGFTRAWHGHKKEAKYAFVVKGTVMFALIKIRDEKDRQTGIILSDKKPQVLYIPQGYYNGFKTLTDDAQIIFFSTSTVEESKDDDFRMPADTWDVFKIDER